MTLYSMFEETSRRYPNNVAASFNSGIAKEYTTYRELDARASKVANCLDILCEGQAIIAIYSKQSIGLVACVLGVLKCGSCFAPVDLNWPPDMICKFLLKLDVSLVLVEKDLLESFQNTSLQWKTNFPGEFRVELIANQDLDVSGFVLARKHVEFKGDTENKEPLDLAYIMQTSGTTGEAKAVRVPHKCIVPNVTDLRDIFQITSDDVVFLASPYTFDPFIVQMFLAFAAGARIAIVPDSIKGMPSKLCHILFDEERVTILQPTPSLMYHIGQDLIRTKILNKDSSLRVLAFGGESCPTLSTLRQWRPPQSNCLIYNLYGITEVSCWASCHHIPTDELVEGSSVACRGKDVEDCIIDEANDVPLGFPLLGTVIEVRDDSGKVVQEGTGQIYIGGTDRVCLLGNETSLATGTMRATGDWAYVKNGSIWFCGRRDRQIKRMGKRINLHCIERQITEQLLESPCSLVLEETDKRNHSTLHLFVVEESSRYDNEKLASLKYNLRNLLPVEALPDYVHVVSRLPMTAHGKVDRGALLAGVEKTSMLGNMTSTREFLEYAWNDVMEVREAESARKTFTCSSSEITEKQRGSFCEGNIKSVNADDMFIACGGSSLEAIRLSDLIESFVSEQKKTPVDLSELLDVILSKSFKALCNYVDGKLTETDKRDGLESKAAPHGPFNEQSSLDSFVAAADRRVSIKELKDVTSARESHLEGASEMNTQQTGAKNENKEVIFDMDSAAVSSLHTPIPPTKRKYSSLADDTSFTDNKAARTVIGDSNLKAKSDLNEHDLFSLSEVKTNCFCSVRRGNQWTVCSFCKYSTLRSTGHETDQTSVQSSCEKEASTLKGKILHQSPGPLEDGKSPGTCVVRQETGTVGDSEFTISCQWRTSLYKCIDASPLVVFSRGTPEGEVFIGSHGHVFMCIRLSDGKVLWESWVGDRIESSAALSICGQFVIVGCYDGKVYVFNRFTGETLWTFQTGAAVKSSPCVDPQTGVTWVGSHDHHLYALDVTNKQCVCAVHCGGGSCFSSPCISKEPYLVFIATLTGRLLAVDPAEHTILWSQQCPKPVFASPSLTPTGIVCACVDGSVYCFDFQGVQLWEFQACGSVFSSPTYVGADLNSTSSDYLGKIVFGSHDKSVYCLSLKGELQWSFTTDGHVYSTPFVAEINANRLTTCRVARHALFCGKRDAGMAVFVWSTLGTLYVLDLHSGVRLASYSLPGEVFSSPVAVDYRLLIGCRNDYLYSLGISNRK